MKGGGFSLDIIIAALIVSAALHAGLMFWVRPQVMTHSTIQRRAARRGPMRVVKADAPPEPVRFETVEDLAAEKSAPEAAEATASLPAAEAASPSKGERIAVPKPELPPEVLVRTVPEGSRELPEAAAEDDFSAPAAPPKMAMESPKLAPAAEAPAPSSLGVALPPAPVFEAPVFSSAAVVEPGAVAKIDAGEKDEGAESGEDASDAVMPKVDEAVVEKEKEAVRSLVDAEDAKEMNSVVRASVESGVDGGWRYFKVKLDPSESLETVPKDLVVLIDASGSIGKDRMKSIRGAAKRILRSAANTGDRFNLVAFRDRYSYAFKSWQDFNTATFDAADRWLNGVAPYGRTDVFRTISSVLTLPRDPKRPLVALVVTDGDANAGVSDTASILSRFTALNDGLVSVYMYGVKESANRELIDILTRGNRGESFIFEGSRFRAGEGLEALSERFRDPVLSDLRLVFASDSRAEAYPRLLRNLYRGRGVELVGRVPVDEKKVSFSLKGLNGQQAFESYFSLDIGKDGGRGSALAGEWRAERAVEDRFRGK